MLRLYTFTKHICVYLSSILRIIVKKMFTHISPFSCTRNQQDVIGKQGPGWVPGHFNSIDLLRQTVLIQITQLQQTDWSGSSLFLIDICKKLTGDQLESFFPQVIQISCRTDNLFEPDRYWLSILTNTDKRKEIGQPFMVDLWPYICICLMLCMLGNFFACMHFCPLMVFK